MVQKRSIFRSNLRVLFALLFVEMCHRYFERGQKSIKQNYFYLFLSVQLVFSQINVFDAISKVLIGTISTDTGSVTCLAVNSESSKRTKNFTRYSCLSRFISPSLVNKNLLRTFIKRLKFCSMSSRFRTKVKRIITCFLFIVSKLFFVQSRRK